MSNRAGRLLYVLTLVAAITGLLFGYDTDVIAGAILFVRRTFHLGPVGTEVVTSAVVLGAIIGAALGGPLSTRLGRRVSILLMAALFCLGSAVTSLAPSASVVPAGRHVAHAIQPALAAHEGAPRPGPRRALPDPRHGRRQRRDGRHDRGAAESERRGPARPARAERAPGVGGGRRTGGAAADHGINTVIYYAPMIFEMGGVGSDSSSILATVGLGCVNVLFTLMAIFLVDRLGRRPLLLISIAGMVLGLLTLAVSLPGAGGRGGGHGPGPVIGLVAYIASFAVGLGPIFWLLISEIYPLRVRGVAMSLASIANWGANFVVSLTFLSLVKAAGPDGTFALFAAVGIGAWLFCFFLVPETKNRSLEEIERELRGGTEERPTRRGQPQSAPTWPHAPRRT